MPATSAHLIREPTTKISSKPVNSKYAHERASNKIKLENSQTSLQTRTSGLKARLQRSGCRASAAWPDTTGHGGQVVRLF